jgi:uncharacterized protein
MADAGEQVPRYPGLAAIDAYGNGGFRFAGMSHKGSLLCLPDSILAWTPVAVGEVTPESLGPVLAAAGRLDFLLVGTGAEHRVLPAPAREALAGRGIGLDVMTTGAAARTWNVLIAEGRRVAAALIAVA